MASGRSKAKTDHIYYKRYSHTYVADDYYLADTDPSYYNGAYYRFNGGTDFNYKVPTGYNTVLTAFTTGTSQSGIQIVRPGSNFNFGRTAGKTGGTARFQVMFIPSSMFE